MDIFDIQLARQPRPTGVSKKTGLRLWKLQSRLVIRELSNASGNISFRLDIPAKIAGKRRQLQFTSFEEAQGEATAALKHKEENGRSGFSLSRSQLDDATKALAIVQPFGVSLEDAAAYYARHEKPKQGDITVSALVDLYVEEKRKGTNTKAGLPVRDRTLSDIECRLGLFTRTHGAALMKDMREDTVKAWLFSNAVLSPQTRVNYFRNLRGFFTYAVFRGFIAENPLARIRVGAEASAPAILTVDQSEVLLTQALAHQEWALIPYVALGLFCGIRSEELAKLQWTHLNMTAGTVTIPPGIAKKRRIRIVTMPQCCREWLAEWLVQNEGRPLGAIRPIGFAKRFRALVKAAGIPKWPHNALRHSAASYHYAKHNNASLTCAMLGQRSDEVLFTHYRSLVNPVDADHFFSLLPPAVQGVVRLVS